MSDLIVLKRIAEALEKIADKGLHITIDHGHIEHIDHVDHAHIDDGDLDVHNHAF